MSDSHNNNLIVQRPSNLSMQFLLLLLLFSFIFAFFPTLKGLVNLWNSSDDYSHGFFILPISLYIIWTKKEKLTELPIVSNNYGLAIVVFSLLVYLFSKFAGIMTLVTFSIIPLACGVVITLFGFPIFKECIFPLTFLVFMMPIPSQFYAAITNPLQLFVSTISTWVASLLNIPIFREGNVIHLPDRTLEVVQACSGLRSLLSLLTLTAIYGYLTLSSNGLRTILFISGIPAAILVNIIRVFIMISAFHYFNFDLATGSIHTIFGTILFVLAIGIVAATKGVLAFWDK